MRETDPVKTDQINANSVPNAVNQIQVGAINNNPSMGATNPSFKLLNHQCSTNSVQQTNNGLRRACNFEKVSKRK